MSKAIRVGSQHFAVVDDADYDELMQYNWQPSKGANDCWYAIRRVRRNGKSHGIYMHRQLMGEPEGLTVDHIDRDGLNNQRANLRLATMHQQAGNCDKQRTNKSGFKGVSWSTSRNLWQSSITANGKQQFIGYFANRFMAARAYDRMAITAFGEFARLNFPDGQRG